jgi:(p)ppGpp synthase/HD superfamily hydrolase
MTKEAEELYKDLQKWSFSSLKAKFVERIETHLRSNTVNRDQMLAELEKLDSLFNV